MCRQGILGRLGYLALVPLGERDQYIRRQGCIDLAHGALRQSEQRGFDADGYAVLADQGAGAVRAGECCRTFVVAHRQAAIGNKQAHSLIGDDQGVVLVDP
ncbi:hypothetical protein ACWGCW_13895 [Streptomyces sp. NPDC054933]